MGLRLPDRWVWDSWYVRDGDTYHAFYLCASKGLGDPNRRHRYTSVGHAISKDLRNWEVLPDALSPSDSPAFDSWTTWTGSIIRDNNDLWWMFYTGTSREDGGDVQSVGAATSKDLMTWTKVSNEPLVRADPNWYEMLDKHIWHDQAWRDPWVFQFPDENTWHMLVTARSKIGDPKTRAVMGHAVSSNLKDWQVLEPLTEPGDDFGQTEVFQFEIVDGVPIVIFCCGWRELSRERLAKFGKRDATYSLVCNPDLSGISFEKALAFESDLVYAGRLIQDIEEKWWLIGFITELDGDFMGELSDPIPVSADSTLGLIRRQI